MIQKDIKDLQQEAHEIENFNASIITENNFYTYLKSTSYSSQNNTIYNVHFYGELKTNVIVISPHFGILKMNIKNYNLNDVNIIDRELIKQTELQFFQEPQILVVSKGINSYAIDERLQASIYTNSNEIPSPGKSVQFIMGKLFIELIFTDIQNEVVITEEFSTTIVGILEIPIF